MSTDQDVPMWRFTERMVRSGLVMACRLATSPTSTSPVLEKPTTDGVVRPPSALGMTTGSPPSRTATTELVVPRSIPTALAIGQVSLEVDGQDANCFARQATRGPPGVATRESKILSGLDSRSRSGEVARSEGRRQQLLDRER